MIGAPTSAAASLALRSSTVAGAGCSPAAASLVSLLPASALSLSVLSPSVLPLSSLLASPAPAASVCASAPDSACPDVSSPVPALVSAAASASPVRSAVSVLSAVASRVCERFGSAARSLRSRPETARSSSSRGRGPCAGLGSGGSVKACSVFSALLRRAGGVVSKGVDEREIDAVDIRHSDTGRSTSWFESAGARHEPRHKFCKISWL